MERNFNPLIICTLGGGFKEQEPADDANSRFAQVWVFWCGVLKLVKSVNDHLGAGKREAAVTAAQRDTTWEIRVRDLNVLFHSGHEGPRALVGGKIK